MKQKLLFALALLLFSAQSHAFMDMEFYTYGSFRETVDGFKRLALFLSMDASPITSLTFSFFAAGAVGAVITSGYTATTSALLQGKADSKIPVFLFSTLLGAGIVSATVFPKNTLHIYDKVHNRYESVGNVPSIIAFVAGSTNFVTEIYRDMLSVSTAYPHEEVSSGTPFELLKAATTSPSQFYGSHLLHSMQNYYLDCAPTASALGLLDLDQLKSGTSSLISEFEKMRHNTVSTTHYSSAYPDGNYVSCTNSFGLIQTELSKPETFERHLNHICTQLHLDTTNAVEANRCKTLIGEVFSTAYNVSGSSFMSSLQNVLAATAIKRAIDTGNADDAIRAQASRTQMAEAVGTWTVGGMYIHKIKGMVLIIILAITPILVLMMMTPLLPISLKLLLVLFGFYTIWDVMDISLVYMVSDMAYAATKEMQESKMGYVSFMLTPQSSIASLTILAQSRTAAISIATLLVAVLFKVSPYALSGLASKAEGNMEKQGEDLGKTYTMQEKAGMQLTEMASGNSSLQTLREVGGMHSYIDGQSANSTREIMSGNILSQSNAVTTAATGSAYNQIESGHSAGALSHEFNGLNNAAVAMGQSSATRGSATAIATNGNPKSKESLIASEKHHIGQGLGYQDAQKLTGESIEVMGSYGTRTQNVQAMSEKDTIERNGYAPEQAYRARGELNAAKMAGDTRYVEGNRQGSFDSASSAAYNEHLNTSAKVDAIDSLTSDPAQHFAALQLRNTADDVHRNILRDDLANTYNASPIEVARMLDGSHRISINEEQAKAAHQAGSLTDDAWNLAQKNGGLAVESDFIRNNDRLDTVSTRAYAGNATRSDDSNTVDKSESYTSARIHDTSTTFNSSQTHDSTRTHSDGLHLNQGVNTQNPYATMQDATRLAEAGEFVSRGATDRGSQERAIFQEMTKISSEGVGNALTQEKHNSSIDTKTARLQTAKLGTTLPLLKYFGVSASYDKSNQDTVANGMDTFRSEYLYPSQQSIMERVDHMVNSGEVKPENRLAAYYDYVADHNRYLASVINGDTPNPLQQNGMQPWQTSPRALFHAWEEDRFNNTSFKEASEIQVPQKENLSETNTWLQPGGYGSGQLIEAMKAKRERDNTGEFKEKTKLDGEHDQHKTRQPPSPHPRTAWGTREN